MSKDGTEMADAELFGNSEQLESDHVAVPGNMVGDLISRQDAIALLEEAESAWLRGDILLFYPVMLKGLKKLPPAQPDIVACGDCIHWICHDRRCGYWNHGVKPLDWCCHAERRTDG